MNIIGTIKQDNNGESYFVGWEQYEKTVYISPNVNGPWKEIEKDIMFESVAFVFAQNYINLKIKQLQSEV